jgi:hypothetical protein
MAHAPDRPAQKEGAKKPYSSPRLEMYGDIREIASSVGSMGANDGGVHGMTKTN